MNIYHRKLYALLYGNQIICQQLECLREHLPDLDAWWEEEELARQIASSSDRVNLQAFRSIFLSSILSDFKSES
jgi:hypothetical protein